MAQRTKLASVLNGLVRNVDLTADELVLDSVTLGGLAGTNLTKAVLDSLIANSHAPMSDNQNVVAGAGLTGGGTGATVTLDIGAGDGITVNTNDVAVDSSVIRTSGANAFAAAQSMGGFKLTNLANPTMAGDAANKDYVDSVAQGLDLKTSVKAATAAALPAVTAAGSGVGKTLTADANGVLTVDGINTWVDVDGDGGSTNPTEPIGTRASRVLVKDQANPVDNGLYVVKDKGSVSTPFILLRSEDADGTPVGEVSNGMFTFVREGSVNADSGWVLTTDNPTVDTTGLAFTQFSGAGSITAGDGLVKVGNTLDIVSADSSMTINADSIQVKLDPAGAIGLDGASAGLEAKVDDSTIEISSNALRVKDGGITDSKLAIDSVTTDKIAAGAVDENKLSVSVAGAGLIGGAGSPLDVNIDNATIEISADIVQVKDLGISTAKIADNAITSDKLAAAVAGNGLSGGAGSPLSVNVDGSTLVILTDLLQIADSGVSTAKILDDAVTKDKIAADVAGNGLGQNVDGSLEVNVDNSTIELNSDAVRVKDAGITLAKLASNSVDESKLTASVAGNGLTGGAGSPLAVGAGSGIVVNANDVEVSFAPAIKKVLMAGESFAADTSFLVRMAVNGETSGRVYKADSANAAVDLKFWAIGLVKPSGAISAGQNIEVSMMGTHTLGTGDSNFNAADIGKAVWLTDAGAFSVVAPADSGDAAFKVGVVQEVDKILLDSKQLTGIN